MTAKKSPSKKNAKPAKEKGKKPAPQPVRYPDACQNCKKPLNDRFCAACGQDHRHRRLDIRRMISAAVGEMLELESPMIRTAIGLTRHPGDVCLDYVKGRRRFYAGPVKYFFIITIASILMMQWFNVDPTAAFGDMNATMTTPAPTEDNPDAVEKKNVNHLVPEMKEIAIENSHLFTFAALPFLGLVLRLIYIDKPYNIAEHWVFVLYGHAQLSLFQIIPFQLGAHESVIGFLILSFVLPIGFLTWVARRFYRENIALAFLRQTALHLAFWGIQMIFGIVMGIVFMIIQRANMI